MMYIRWLLFVILSQIWTPANSQIHDENTIPAVVAIPSGRYVMGTPKSEEGHREDEGPQHEVVINKPFYAGRTEVTREQFAHFIKETGYQPIDRCLTNENGWSVVEGRTWQDPGFRQGPGEPVVCVNWHNAQAYVQWLSESTGEKWRLPTESEWEYFSRAGTNGRFSNNSENEEDLCGIAYAANPSICPSRYDWLAPVGLLKPNKFGLHDVHGNVFEWTEDCYHSTYEGAPTDGSDWTVNCENVVAQGEERDNLRVIRGGSTFSPPAFVRSGLRSWSEEETGHINVGFRVVKELGRQYTR